MTIQHKITTNEKEDNKVIEINNPGLFLDKQIDNRIIIKSKVTILHIRRNSKMGGI